MPIVNIKETSGIGIGTYSTTTSSDKKKLEINEDWIVSGLYPVGSIHITTDNTNPSKYFGGTWTRFSQGRVLVCVDSTDSNLSTVQTTGGEKKHTIVLDEMPKHRHSHSQEDDKIKSGSSANDRPGSYTTTATAYWYNSPQYSASGATTPHNNLQPYITCYMWLRIE